jgi:hypothetical protein
VHSHRDRTIRLPITTARTLITDPAAAESGTVTRGCLRANLSRWDPEVAKSHAERIAHTHVIHMESKRISIRGQLTPMEAAIPKEAGATRPANNRTAYCRRQAAESALAATTANLGEIREAYLNIEQAWLQLAPDIDSGKTFSGKLRKP